MADDDPSDPPREPPDEEPSAGDDHGDEARDEPPEGEESPGEPSVDGNGSPDGDPPVDGGEEPAEEPPEDGDDGEDGGDEEDGSADEEPEADDEPEPEDRDDGDQEDGTADEEPEPDEEPEDDRRRRRRVRRDPPEGPGPDTGDTRTSDRVDEAAVLREEIERLRDEIDELEERVDTRTVDRSEVEADLRRYVRRRARRSHARGWGPYVVLLYGTILALGAFYLLEGGWAIAAMFVVWTSTLGVYVLMLVFGIGLSLAKLPFELNERLQAWRS